MNGRPADVGTALNAPNMTMPPEPLQGPIGEADLRGAYPWPASGRWIRGMMVTTLDGGSVGADGRSGSISSPVDRAVMAEVRRHCDAILVGASTFRVERYRPQRPTREVQLEREALGLRPAPVIIVVSRSLDLPWEEDAFRESLVPPLVVTGESCAPEALALGRQHAEVAVLPGERVEVADLVQLLAERGLDRIVCEGGSHLLAEIARHGYLDELDLAISPLMAGGGQIALGEPDAAPARYRLVQAVAADGFLFTRYLRAGTVSESSEAVT